MTVPFVDYDSIQHSATKMGCLCSSGEQTADAPMMNKGLWGSVVRYIWDDPDKSAREKKFLLKLDIFLLSYACLGYLRKNLAKANINNAYVSGMK
jgi:hypothetical protein